MNEKEYEDFYMYEKARKDMSKNCKFLCMSFEQFKKEYPDATWDDWIREYENNCGQCIYEHDICMYGEQ